MALRRKTHSSYPLKRAVCLLGAMLVLSLVGCAVPKKSKGPIRKPLAIEPAAPSVASTLKMPHKVKIGLRMGIEEIKISCGGGMRVKDLDRKPNQEWASGTYRFTIKDSMLLEGGVQRGKNVLISALEDGFPIEVNGRPYRGDILLRVINGKFNVINELSVDDYLKGVLPREVGVSWSIESLKAQAVASRTYLVSHLGQHGQQGFDLCSDVHCQVYGGREKEHPATNTAVDETRGEILVWNGKPIQAFFHSNCGGATEAVEYVWGLNSQPYLVKKKCHFGTEDPRYHWKKIYANNDILKALKAKTKVAGSELHSVKIHAKSPSGRASKVAVKTDQGTYILSGNEFRIALNPEIIRSMLWTRLEKLKDAYCVEGRGWGHGVGLCQWGAKGQAENGRTYRKILDFYYPGCDLAVW